MNKIKISSKYKKIIKQINELEHIMSELSDEQFKNKTIEFKNIIKNGIKPDEILVEVYAVAREATKRVTGKRLYDVQLMGGVALNEGRIAEIKAGEGKTLTAILPVYLNALEGKGVHVITTNEYLAKRDYGEISKILHFLGVTAGLIEQSMSIKERKEAYQKEVTYGTNTEFGFDYLRDNTTKKVQDIVQRQLNFAIVDEADSILLDEANTPLIISNCNQEPNKLLYKKIDELVKTMDYITIIKEKYDDEEQHEKLEKYDYFVNESLKTAQLTLKGIEKVEKEFNINNLYDPSNIEILSAVTQSLKANGIIYKDIDYIISDGKIKIIDKYTGRIMEGKRFCGGLHEAIETKENLEIQNMNKILATISSQNYFKLYKKLSGMTGTAKASEKEFNEVYNLDVIEIPTNKPIKRIDYPDKIFENEEIKFEKVVEEIKNNLKIGQPILVGTTSIKNSEKICKILDKNNISYNLLNAKNHEKEAKIVSQAGKYGKTTIATNMAGRGTNILIDQEKVAPLGGLKVIGTEKHESSRIDEQLRGRSGRQGQVGESIFFLSQEDELLRVFGKNTKSKKSGEITNNKTKKEFIKAQKRAEDINYTIRKNMVKYDNIININRKIIYAERKKILEAESGKVFKEFVDYFCKKITKSDEIYSKNILERFGSTKPEDIKNDILNKYDEKIQYIGKKEFEKVEKQVQLNVIDEYWIDFIEKMNILLDNIELRRYARHDPVNEFIIENSKAFEKLNEIIKLSIVTKILFGIKYEECI